MSFKIGQVYTGREICVLKSIGLAYSKKGIYVSNLQQVFTEIRLEDVDLSETQPVKYFAYMDRENLSQRLKSERRKQQYTVTLFDGSHLAHVSIRWQCKNLCFNVQFLLCVILNLRAISKYKPPGACIWRGDLTGGFWRFEFGGSIHGGAYFRNFTIFELQLEIDQTQTHNSNFNKLQDWNCL